MVLYVKYHRFEISGAIWLDFVRVCFYRLIKKL